MTNETVDKICSFLKLLTLHRGEAKEAYDKVALAYDGFASVWDGVIAAPAMRYYNELIAQRVPDGAIVLDAGSGTGERTKAILNHSNPGRIVCVDASTGMLSVARSKIKDPRVVFEEGDIHKLRFEDNTFDVVSCTWVVEIMDDPKLVVEEFLRVVKPEGFVLYAFCSLPDGKIGRIVDQLLHVLPGEQPLSHLLSEKERPFHKCEYSSLKQFSGGLVSVATVAKCCSIVDVHLPCRLRSFD